MGTDYQPNDAALAKLPQVTLVAVIGPTGVGKTTLINAASARCPALHQVISTTSRTPRPDETNDVDMHFRNREEMLARAQSKDYVTLVTNVTGELYATAPEDYSTEGIAIMPTLADAMPIFTTLPFKAVRSIFVLPPSWDIWRQRIAGHGFSDEEFEKRMQEASRSLRYAIDSAENLVYVVNDDVAQATLDFTQAALGASAAANQYKSHDLAVTLLKELQNR